jgi:cytochrome c556
LQRIDDLRATVDSLAHAAEDIPSVSSEVGLSESDEELFYQFAEQLNASALDLRDTASVAPAMLNAAFASVVSTCDACHSRFRVMPAANIESVK